MPRQGGRAAWQEPIKVNCLLKQYVFLLLMHDSEIIDRREMNAPMNRSGHAVDAVIQWNIHSLARIDHDGFQRNFFALLEGDRQGVDGLVQGGRILNAQRDRFIPLASQCKA